MTEVISRHGWEGYGHMCALLRLSEEIGAFNLTADILAKQFGMRVNRIRNIISDYQILFSTIQQYFIIRNNTNYYEIVEGQNPRGRNKYQEREREKEIDPPLPPLGGSEGEEVFSRQGELAGKQVSRGTVGEKIAEKRRPERSDAGRARTPASEVGETSSYGSQGDGGYFDQFWSEYPRKVAKRAVEQAWKSRKFDRLAGEIISAVRAHKNTEQWQKDKGRFIPNPLTFLNQGRWEDALDVPVSEPTYTPPAWLRGVL